MLPYEGPNEAQTFLRDEDMQIARISTIAAIPVRVGTSHSRRARAAQRRRVAVRGRWSSESAAANEVSKVWTPVGLPVRFQ